MEFAPYRCAVALVLVVTAWAGRSAGQDNADIKRLFDAHDYQGCLNLIDRAGARVYSDDQAQYYRAGSLLGLGNYKAARDRFTAVLMTSPQMAPAHLGRAMAAAHMGCADRVAKDLEVAFVLDPVATAQYRAENNKAIDALLARVPKESPAELLGALRKAAALPESSEQLAARGEQLALARNAAYFVRDEAYQDRLWDLRLAVVRDPKNADRIAELAQFLFDPFLVRTVTYEGHTGQTRVRLNGGDNGLADRAITAALQLDPNHFPAITTKALILQNGNADQGIQWAQRSLQMKNNAGCARFWLEYYSNAAGQLGAQAKNLRQSHSRTENRGDGPHVITTFPSAADLALADQLDAKADDLRRLAASPMVKLITELGENSAEGKLLRGEFDHWRGHEDEAQADGEAAVKLDFFNHDAREFLSDLATGLHRPEVAQLHEQALQNFVNPWAGYTLNDAWKLFPQQKWAECLKLIDVAERLSPADAAIAAFRASMAAFQYDDASLTREAAVTVAMEEGRARAAGLTLGKGTGRLEPDDVLLTMNVRCLLAAYYNARGNPRGATALFQANANLAARVVRDAWRIEVEHASVPCLDPAANAKPPSINSLLAQAPVAPQGRR